jgi:hypothetical protein
MPIVSNVHVKLWLVVSGTTGGGLCVVSFCVGWLFLQASMPVSTIALATMAVIKSMCKSLDKNYPPIIFNFIVLTL